MQVGHCGDRPARGPPAQASPWGGPLVTRSLPLSTYSDSGVGQRGAVGHSVELPLSRCQARAPRTCLRPGLRGRGGAETALCSPGFGFRCAPGRRAARPGRRDQGTEPLRNPCRALPTCVGHSPKPQSCRNSFYFVFKRCVHFLGHLTNTHTHTRTRAPMSPRGCCPHRGCPRSPSETERA